jgi:hypothetical protein
MSAQGCFGAAAFAMAVLAASPAGSQTNTAPGFSAAADPNAAIVKLLQSENPKDQAWGAWYAGRDNLTELTPLVQQVIAQHVSGSSLSEVAAVDVALDALIQMRRQLPSTELRRVHERRPVQSLILAAFAQKNDAEADEFLLEVLRSEKYYEWTAAANLLVARKTPGVATTLIKGLRLTIDVRVTDGETTGRWGTEDLAPVGAGHGGSGIAPGLPPWAQYFLELSAAPGFVVHSTGPNPVYYHRMVTPAGSTPGFTDRLHPGPSATDRLRYLASLAGRADTDLPVQPIERHEVQWTGIENLNRAVATMLADVRLRWASFSEMLVHASALETRQAAVELPTFVVVFHDSRRDRSVPLDGR